MKKIICIVLLIVMAFAMIGCSNTSVSNNSGNYGKSDINIYVLSGPTGIGAVNMWEDADNGTGKQNYIFHTEATPDAIVSKISTGEADIAAIATNLATKLYIKTNGGIKMIAVNTRGVLSVLDNSGFTAKSLADLKGKKIVATGQGANPEYIIRYLLSANGVDPDKDIDLEFVSDGSELSAIWAKPENKDAIIIAPQPVATAIQLKFKTAKELFDLTDEWAEVNDDSQLMMGCVVVRNDFLQQHPEAIKDFLEDYSASVKTAVQDKSGTAEKCEKYGITANAQIAENAIDSCNLCVVSGKNMKKNIDGYYKMLFDADPASVGAVPDDAFYADVRDEEWYAQ